MYARTVFRLASSPQVFRKAAPSPRLLQTTCIAAATNPESNDPTVVAGLGLERKIRTGSEDLETMRRRLLYQMRKRGILETDLLLSTFAAQHLGSLSHTELGDLDSLLSNIDWDIFYWATGKTQPPESVCSMPVFQKLRDHASKRGRTIVRMPDLKQPDSKN
ncbi:Succinate dehydrogenase assembly factor 2 mitochondrial [Coemansia guatemalensis]|uniref:Succinate dehydrogenase assembly factor 2, mitochondrial n=1 Tax=Coemansia guatemalensis TaxID=2761395 RepID=A0A9W8LSH9_9FUNG|nr:Succinate dehydrogenase assembly factor 2 mitochondrial [Coemansia guatemalensis]